MKTFLLSLLGGIFGAIITLFVFQKYLTEAPISPPETKVMAPSVRNPVLDYYESENAVSVSPHDLRMEMDKWATDTIIVDLRSAPEYEKEHIRGAINIPGIANDTDAAAQEARIIAAFEKLPKDKRIIVHCYTHYCMLAKHVGLMLAKKWIYVHELNIGWNEWRYQWDLWNGEGTSKTVRIEDYLEGTAVKKAGTGTINNSGTALVAPCTADGLAGC